MPAASGAERAFARRGVVCSLVVKSTGFEALPLDAVNRGSSPAPWGPIGAFSDELT